MSHMTIQHRNNGQVAIVDLDGKLTLGEASVALRECVRALLADGRKSILIGLERVSYMDSSGLGELVSAFAAAKRQDASLKLVNVTKHVEGLLQLTKLLTIFETFDSEDDAVRSFESGVASASEPNAVGVVSGAAVSDGPGQPGT